MTEEVSKEESIKIDRSKELQRKIRSAQLNVSSLWDEIARVNNGTPEPFKMGNEVPRFLMADNLMADNGEKHVIMPTTQVTPDGLLRTAADTIALRGAKRDNGSERSMERIVKVFSALTDHKLTEEEGWLFMIVLKLCRERTGADLDNWVDGAAYMALAAEAVSRNKTPT